MKPLITLIMLFLSIQLFSQKLIPVEREVQRIEKIDTEKIFNKKTGKKIPKEEFVKLVRNNPHLNLEYVYDNSGNIEKYIYDPDGVHSGVVNTDTREKIRVGEKFPNLSMKTIDGKTVEIEDLQGKMVLLRMETEANSIRFKKHEIAALDKAINSSGRQSEIEALILFRTSEEDVKKGFDLKDSNFAPIPNGVNFQSLLNIRIFPSTIILDKEGRVMNFYKGLDKIDIEKLLDEA